MYYFKKVLDLIEEGVIVIDKNGFIKVYNNPAKSVFGLSPDMGKGHRSGYIKDGDIVIIADNLLGGDDGNLEGDDLNMIGISSKEIKTGDAIVAIGKKGDKSGDGRYKSIDTNRSDIDILTLEKTIRGLEIKASIDFDKKCLSIIAGKDKIDYHYSWCAGHIVILDKDTMEIKFYQSKGYTARGEELKKVLLGDNYEGKGKDIRPIKIINRHISDIHTCSFIINELLEIAKGKEAHVKSMESSINGIPVRCSIYAIEEAGARQGAMLKILDITELNELRTKNRNYHLKNENEKSYREIEQIQNTAFKNIVYESAIMRETIEMAKLTSETNSTVLLQGESGTGKGVFAQAIHDASQRRKNSFVYINCASIPENLLESELFGHEKGSFTGAFFQKSGKFEIATKGTIFLDEIGEIPLPLQAKLLHVLQSRCFTRVGGINNINIDVRVIAASNKNLRKLVEEGKFREDLFYRLNVFPIYIPPLRERKQDIYYLIKNMLPELCEKCGKVIEHISADFTQELYNYDWPGNIRELENILERAIALTHGKTLFPNTLPDYIFSKNRVRSVENERTDLVEIINLSRMKDIIAETERKAIQKAIEICNGKKKDAYELLGMGKTNFFNKCKDIDEGSIKRT